MYWWYPPPAPTNAQDPGPEPDAFTCDCAVKDSVQGAKPTLGYCAWYEYRKDTGKTEEPEPPQNNSQKAIQDLIYQADLQEYRSAAKHLRMALRMQCAGYKGSQHYRVLEIAREERNKLIGI